MVGGKMEKRIPECRFTVGPKLSICHIMSRQRCHFCRSRVPDEFVHCQVDLPDGTDTVEGFFAGCTGQLVQDSRQLPVLKDIRSKNLPEFLLFKER